MDKIKNLSVRAKIFGGFLAITLITIVFAGYVIKVINEFSDDTNSQNLIQKKADVAKSFQVEVLNIWQFITDGSLVKEKGSIDEAELHYQNAEKYLKELVVLEKDNPEIISSLDKTSKDLDEVFSSGVKMYESYLVNYEEGNKQMDIFDERCSNLFSDVDHILEKVNLDTQNSREEIVTMVSSGNKISIIIFILSVVLSLLIAIVITNWLNKSLFKLTTAADRLAVGDVDINISSKSNDEIGKLEKSFNALVENIKEQSEIAEKISDGELNVKITPKSDKDVLSYSLNKVVANVKNLVLDVNTLSDSAIEGKLSTRINEDKHHGEYKKVVSGFNNTLNAIGSPFNETIKILKTLASGDLTTRMTSECRGDYNIIKESINKVAYELNTTIARVNEAIHATASAANEISSSTEQMAAGAQEQSSHATEVAGAVEEMTKTIYETTKNTTQATQASKNAGKVAKEGGKVVEETIEGMNKISEVVKQSAETVLALGKSSDQIGEIVQVIDDIAEQTNLLALNAAIEAARAGEQGRGFAVVADEVRKLAERTTKATKEIASMIKQIQQETKGAVTSMRQGTEEVENGKVLAERAGASLFEIIHNAGEVEDIVTQVAAASEEQSSAAEQISKNIESISSVTQESASGIQQIAHASEDLNRLTLNLQELVAQFKVDDSSSKYAVRQNGKLIHI